MDRSQHERAMAEIAVHHRLITREQLDESLAIQNKLSAKHGKRVRLMKILLKRELLSERHVHFLKTGDGVGLDLTKDRHRRAIKGYELIRPIGYGGTATIYLAERTADGFVLAVKALFTHRTRSQRKIDSFLKEGRLLEELDHPNIVKGYDTGESRNLFYVALEFIDGYSVKQLLDAGGPMNEDLALWIIIQVARSLSYLSSVGVTHRDIKPGNILIDRQGTIKLCDLGFALTDDAPEDELIPGRTIGTAQYISPEQVGGEEQADVRSDIYSLGATLYHMIVGDVPFGQNRTALLAKEIRRELSEDALHSRGISPQTHYFLEKMMADDREVRYGSPDELIEDIEGTTEGLRELMAVLDPNTNQVIDPLTELRIAFERVKLDDTIDPHSSDTM